MITDSKNHSNNLSRQLNLYVIRNAVYILIPPVLTHSSPSILFKASTVAKVNGKYLTLRTALCKTLSKYL